MGFFEYAKVMMVLYNLLILAGGGGLIALGFWMRLSGDLLGSDVLRMFSISAVNIINVDIFFISVGIIMFLLGFLGCCGAKKESKCLLITYFSIIAIILISEMTIGLYGLAYSASVGKYLISWGRPALQDKYGRDSHYTNLLNSTMTELNCCGFNNYTDFINSYYFMHHGNIYHPSCCANSTVTCDMETAQNSTVPGCFKWIEKALDERLYIIGATTTGVGGIEIGALTVSLYLYCYLDKDAS